MDPRAALAEKVLFAPANMRMVAVVVVGEAGRRVDASAPSVAVVRADETVAGETFEPRRTSTGTILARAVCFASGGTRLIVARYSFPTNVAATRKVYTLAVMGAVVRAFLLRAVLTLKPGTAHTRAIGTGQMVSRALQPVLSERARWGSAPVSRPTLFALAAGRDPGG